MTVEQSVATKLRLNLDNMSSLSSDSQIFLTKMCKKERNKDDAFPMLFDMEENGISLHKQRDALILEKIFQDSSSSLADLPSQQPNFCSNQSEHIADTIQQSNEIIDISNTSDEEMEANNVGNEGNPVSYESDSSLILTIPYRKRKHEDIDPEINVIPKRFKKSKAPSYSRSANSPIPYNSPSSIKISFPREAYEQVERPEHTIKNLHDFNNIKVEQKECLLNFYCPDCQINLSNEVTFKTHLAGKRHFKAVKAQHLTEIAKGSIELPKNPPFATFEKPRFGQAAAGRKRVRISEVAKLQELAYTTRYPMPGLNHLQEIQIDNELTYYCVLCDAPGDPSTVMKHLIGFRHQLNCLKYIKPDYYRAVKRGSKELSKSKLKRILLNDQDEHGIMKIKVYKELVDKRAIMNPIDNLYFDRPGPSWGNDAIKQEPAYVTDSVASNEYLDTSKGGFRCTLCNSHMNNLHMWAIHLRGDRHLKNTMKAPGESISKVKSFRAPPHYVPDLVRLLKEEAWGKVVVGLDYIRETHGPNGIIYNCFLCGACTTNYDIVEHILLSKHRIKYLEKLQVDGKDNSISLIKQMDISLGARDSLVQEESLKMAKQYGRGRIEVYISKNIY